MDGKKFGYGDRAFKRAMQQDVAGELGEEKVRQMVADYKRRI
ncbi:MAG: hypothetical protein QGG39_18620 [Candidatus Poribacteria bacterium]|jgi:hypothetical protein|nr:hypothetical protein [Candidatus Poribacteria bacterium]|tara:strand:+ start:521 stop:646 length:126 start_codon:yes stop_codon:yes gene_type:complete